MEIRTGDYRRRRRGKVIREALRLRCVTLTTRPVVRDAPLRIEIINLKGYDITSSLFFSCQKRGSNEYQWTAPRTVKVYA